MILPIIKKYSKPIRTYLITSLIIVLIEINMIVTFTYVLGNILPEQPSAIYPFLFIASLILVYTMYSYNQKKAIFISESIISDTREEIIEQVRKCELQSFEKIEKVGVYNVITVDTQVMADSVVLLLRFTEYGIVTLVVLAYFLFVSQLMFLFTLFIFVVGFMIYGYYIIKSKKLIHQARIKEKELMGATKDCIDGFKELKSNDHKNDDFYHQCFKIKSHENRLLRVKAEHLLIESYVHSLWLEYGIFIPILFIMPPMGWISYDIMISCVTLILLIPFGVLKDAIPYLVRAFISAERVLKMENTLKQLRKENNNIFLSKKEILHFKEIKYKNICFDYTDKTGAFQFGLDKVSCSFYPGEIIFITGGNGSGKSTLLKVLSGLYFPLSGSVSIDGKDIQLSDCRYLFSSIFSDFHLFDRFYGFLEGVDYKKVDQLMKMMALDRKVSIEKNKFSTLDLSTGQKKRLAMIVSIMEDKPIYIFDEWASDQSPRFRNYFYYEILPSLRSKGKTVIAVTHDEQYFNISDRILTLDFGKLV
ncbi:peptide ABC transporter ATP-binding protein [Candidatus Magnetomorum sp. HK-1]|nr:peptide ABC transporter ATP-binding protein [Candidatus Magnetomorum sp. HK-1]